MILRILNKPHMYQLLLGVICFAASETAQIESDALLKTLFRETRSPEDIPNYLRIANNARQPISTHRHTSSSNSEPFYLNVAERARNNRHDVVAPTYQSNSGEIPNYLKIFDKGRTLAPNSSPSGTFTGCGVAASIIRPQIANGENALEAEWPWHAAIYLNVVLICGGTVVSSRHIITAAHCVTEGKDDDVRNPSTLDIFLGKLYAKDFDEKNGQRFDVDEISVHPEYNGSVLTNDIAVLKLSRRIQYTNHIRSICFWSGGSDISNIVGQYGTVVGWGADETLTRSNVLKKTRLPVVSHRRCRNSNDDYRNAVTDKMFCAGFRNGTTTCVGDSGGGMYFFRTSDRVWQLRGIVSFARDTNRCEGRHYTVFTDVTKYHNWINNIL